MLTVLFFLMVAFIAVLALASGQAFALRELRGQLRDVQFDRDILRQEVQVLTDALARGNRTPILRDPAKALTRLETWYEGRAEVARFTAGKGEG